MFYPFFRGTRVLLRDQNPVWFWSAPDRRLQNLDTRTVAINPIPGSRSASRGLRPSATPSGSLPHHGLRARRCALNPIPQSQCGAARRRWPGRSRDSSISTDPSRLSPRRHFDSSRPAVTAKSLSLLFRCLPRHGENDSYHQLRGAHEKAGIIALVDFLPISMARYYREVQAL